MIKHIVSFLLIISLVLITPLYGFSKSFDKDTETEKALIAAWNDSKQAQLIYQSVVHKFGQVTPFVMILKEERQHEEMLMSLFAKYGFDMPTETLSLKTYDPKNIVEACQIAIEKEKASAELYTKYLKIVKLPCIWHTFGYIQRQTQEKHIPAFELKLKQLTEKKVLS